MTKITFLGTASAVPDKDHQNTHFLIESGDRVFLIDCVGNPVVRLDQAGVDPLSISDLVLTHFHPDHVSAAPLLLMDLWLMGRTTPLNIYGLSSVITSFNQMMDLYQWHEWETFYPVIFHTLAEEAMVEFEISDAIRMWAAPVCHLIPCMGIRLAFPEDIVCYSSDTAPCEAVIQLAMGVDILIHEATGEGSGHSSAEQAGQIAQKCQAKKMYLIHYPPKRDRDALVKQAKRVFSGEVYVAEDLMTVRV